MTTLYFDCFSGASGDMILGALLDAGAPEDEVRGALDALDVPGWKLEVSTVARSGMRALRAKVSCSEPDAAERTHHDVLDVLSHAALPDAVMRRAVRVFDALANAEGRIHGVDPQEVRFHEVGSLDAIIDVVGCCAALEHFMPERVITSPITTGTGSLVGAHGTLPLPAPAVTEIMQGRGATLVGHGTDELITPTAAALLATFSDDFGDLPRMRLEGSGYGAGARELDHPNVLRVLVGSASESVQRRTALLIESNIDDMSPEVVPHLIDSLIAAGAHDAWVTPIVMKKGRPALTLSVLGAPEDVERLTEIVFREATTLGVRMTYLDKDELARRSIEVEVHGQTVRVKLGLRNGAIVTISPEHDDALEVARATGAPLKSVYARALRAAEDELERGRPS